MSKIIGTNTITKSRWGSPLTVQLPPDDPVINFFLPSKWSGNKRATAAVVGRRKRTEIPWFCENTMAIIIIIFK